MFTKAAFKCSKYSKNTNIVKCYLFKTIVFHLTYSCDAELNFQRHNVSFRCHMMLQKLL